MYKARPGYVLLIVMAVGVAAGLAAAVLITTAGGQRMAAIHVVDGELAGGIAAAGMTRVEGYLQAVLASDKDFDRALDPGLDADCTSRPIRCPQTGSDADCIPAFTDASKVLWEGKLYARVAYNGGAYLVRFDDDDDDGMSNGDWKFATGNNVGDDCFEGPDSSSTAAANHLGGADNPLRDRNRSMYVTVIGIYPGEDVASARHRKVLRSRYVAPFAPIEESAFLVGGGVSILGGHSSAEMCSTLSGIVVRDGLNGSGSDGCSCGKTYGSPISGNWQACTGGCCGSNRYETPPGTPAPPVVRPTRDPAWFADWDSECVFYMRESDPSSYDEGLWFWDADGVRNDGSGNVTCRDYAGPLVDPGSSVSGVSWAASCWVPIFVEPPSNPSTYIDPCSLGEGKNLASDIGGWFPKDVAVAQAASDCGGYYSGPINVTKPAWGACQGADPVYWSPPGDLTGSLVAGCTGYCDGSRKVLEMHEDNGDGEWLFMGPQNSGDISVFRAYPVGVYFFRGDYAQPNSMQSVSPGSSGSVTTANDFPMITLVVDGNFTLSSASTMRLGVGTRTPQHPSLVARTIRVIDDAELELAGALVTTVGAIDVTNEARAKVSGPLITVADLRVDEEGSFRWDYDYDMLTEVLVPPSLSSVPAPMLSPSGI